MAKELIAGHRSEVGRPTLWGEGPFGKGSPWDMLYEHNAWWVLVDASWPDTPFIAYVQALYAERHSGITKQTPFPRFNTEALGQKLKDLGLLHQATWGPHTLLAFEMRKAVDAALQTLGATQNNWNLTRNFGTGWPRWSISSVMVICRLG